jgi:hypothetical protein
MQLFLQSILSSFNNHPGFYENINCAVLNSHTGLKFAMETMARNIQAAQIAGALFLF